MNELNKLGLDVIHPKKGDTILLRYEYGGDMEIEKIADVMNAVKQMFPDNRVLCVPWQMSPADLDELDVKEYARVLKRILTDLGEFSESAYVMNPTAFTWIQPTPTAGEWWLHDNAATIVAGGTYG